MTTSRQQIIKICADRRAYYLPIENLRQFSFPSHLDRMQASFLVIDRDTGEILKDKFTMTNEEIADLRFGL